MFGNTNKKLEEAFNEESAVKSLIDPVIMRNPDAQINAWVNSNKEQWDFWQVVLRREAWGGLNKTKEQVENLVGYFEGCYDMSLKIREFVAQKKIDTQPKITGG